MAVSDWHLANQRYLAAALEEMRDALEAHAAAPGSASQAGESGDGARVGPPETNPPPAIETLCELLGLSLFERQVVLLCAGMELDGSFPSLCAAAQGEPGRPHATFGLALAALPEAHWSAISPAGPLRAWRLVEVAGEGGVTSSPLKIDERVLHFLTGVPHLDERLRGYVTPVQADGDLVASHCALAERVAAAWVDAAKDGVLPVVQLCGEDEPSQRAVAVEACARLGLDLHAVVAEAIPADPRELDALMRLLDREAILAGRALWVDCRDRGDAEATRWATIRRLIETTLCPTIVADRQPRPLRGRSITLDVRKPLVDEQRALWRSALGDAGERLDGEVDLLASQFSMSAPAIYATCAEAVPRTDGECDEALGEVLREVCRSRARLRLDDLAARIEPAASWQDLVLPAAQKQILQEIAVHLRQRAKVYEEWGFAAKCSRGLGISALFVGSSGTGKTMAAEVLAGELKLDLYHIDLSQVVSKYIGETEKNLGRVFDAADEGGCILLFDEADALFGKRSEVKDSHDRYANIEVSYLLQRMEVYRGLAILTTNMKSALDTAFLRRIRFIVHFPFPDAGQRAKIWRRVFPSGTPTKGLDEAKLARLNVAGGNIRNMALHAAFLAAEADEPVLMEHLAAAARTEYAKLEKPLTEAEIRGWT